MEENILIEVTSACAITFSITECPHVNRRNTSNDENLRSQISDAMTVPRDRHFGTRLPLQQIFVPDVDLLNAAGRLVFNLNLTCAADQVETIGHRK